MSGTKPRARSDALHRLLFLLGPEPVKIAVMGAVLSLFLQQCPRVYKLFRRRGIVGIKAMISSFLIRIMSAFGQKYIEPEQIRSSVRKDILPEAVRKERSFSELPPKGLEYSEIEKTLERYHAYEKKSFTEEMHTGAVYHGGDKLLEIQSKAFGHFGLANPLHVDMFPFLRKMETEVVQMTVNVFNGDRDACGLTTSGGTESIILAVKMFETWALNTKGITDPEFIIPATAHAAFNKACMLLKITAIMVPIDEKTGRVRAEDMEKCISSNTIGMVGSAPCYPNGNLDPIEELGQLALKYNICLHVDCCLGSFLISMLEKIGHTLPKFDLRVPGVTTISVDTHKFGYSVKGSSVLLVKSHKMRHNAYIFVPEWTGGIYGTPGIPGSRPGGVIAATWAAMVKMGLDGYKEAARLIMKEADAAKDGIRALDGVELVGDPVSSTVTFRSTIPKVPSYGIAEAMKERGFILSRMQNPMGCHFTFTYVHRNGGGAKYVEALKWAIQENLTNPEKYSAAATLYGSAAEIPSGAQTEILSELLKIYFDYTVDFHDADKMDPHLFQSSNNSSRRGSLHLRPGASDLLKESREVTPVPNPGG